MAVGVTSPIRVLLFDIEATDLEASFGHVLCVGYKYLDAKRTKVVSLEDVPKPKPGEEPDAPLMREIHRVLTEEADIIVTYYGKGYDRKFLNTRMLLADLPPLPPLNSEHVDLYFTARGNLKLHSNRLQAVAETLGCPVEKTPVKAQTWRLAMRGDRKALAYVVEHCRRDVEILEWCYKKLRPFVRQHPPTGAFGACRVCGADRWQRRGRAISTTAVAKMRIQCQGCGAWSTRPAIKEAA